MQDRANALHAGIALDQHVGHERALDAARDTFDDAIAACHGGKLHHEIFSPFGRAATIANARRIAAHPDCPASVRKEIELRVSAGQAPANTPSAPAQAKGDAASGEAPPDPNE